MPSEQDRKEMLRKVREKMNQRKGGRQKDPHEWRAPKVAEGKELKIKCYVLPPISPGDTVESGLAEGDMQGLFYYQVGDHWINKKKLPCPRAYDNDDCPYCQLGFDLMKETDDKKARSELARTYLPKTSYVVNLYFPPFKSTPEDLRGKVFYYAAPKTIFDKFDECLNRDDDGGDPDNPEPYGLFYEPNEAYPFLIHITAKGEYNDYNSCKFLAAGRGPILEDSQKLQAILDQRHDIPSKYPARTPENLKTLSKIVDDLLKGSSGDDDGDGDGDNGGFDADENASSKNQKSAPKTPPKSTNKPAPKADVVDDDEMVETKASANDDELIEETPKSKTPAKPAKAKTEEPAAETKAEPAAKGTALISEEDDEELQSLLRDITG